MSTTSTSILPTTGETIRDLLPTIELTPRVVEALDDENWRLGVGEPAALAEVSAIARALVVRIGAAAARRLAQIRVAWAGWDAEQQTRVEVATAVATAVAAAVTA